MTSSGPDAAGPAQDETAQDESAAFAAFEVAGWEAHAQGYELLLARVTARLAEPLLDAAAAGAGSRVLDVACGPGHGTALAAARQARATGVDIAPAMVALARARRPDLDFRIAAAEELPWDAGSFDVVVGSFLVHHLARPEAALAEFARVLAPGGRLALTAWDEPARCRLIGVLVDAIAEVGAAVPAGLPAGPPFFRYSAEGAFDALLGAGGFAGAEVRTVAFTYPVASVEALWAGLMSGTVRTSALVVGQPEKVQQRIRAAFDRYAEEYRTGDGLDVPVSVKLASGHKAA